MSQPDPPRTLRHHFFIFAHLGLADLNFLHLFGHKRLWKVMKFNKYISIECLTPSQCKYKVFVWIFVMKSRDTWGGRSPDSWLIHDHQFFLKGKVLTYSPQLPYWDIRVSQTTFTQLGQLWRNEQIMPAPRRSPIQVLTQPSVAVYAVGNLKKCLKGISRKFQRWFKQVLGKP